MGDLGGSFNIAVYASSDGEALEEQLELAENVVATQGLHTLTIEPTFEDIERDYYLVAVVDPANSIEETNEDDNQKQFLPGSFLVHQPATATSPAKTILHAHDGDDADTPVAAFRMPQGGGVHNWMVYTSQAAIAAPTTGTKYDFTGDGLVTALDAAAYTNYQQGDPTAWQHSGNRFDVNGDGFTAPSDALLLIEDFRLFDEHLLTGSPETNDPRLDVSGDLVASVLDLAQLLDKLNGGSGDLVPASRDSTAPYSASAAAISAYLAGGQLHYGNITIDEVHLRGHGGDDGITLGQGNTPGWLFGGDGHDGLGGSDVADRLYGGDGRDIIFGMGGDDLIFGEGGMDSLFGEVNDLGEPWNPIPYTPAGNDTIYGGRGNDLIEGNSGDDTLFGHNGDNVELPPPEEEGEGEDPNPDLTDDDTVNGGAGDDEMHGEFGDDTMNGEGGDDWMFGEDGEDEMVGGEGTNTLNGGQGDDTLTSGPNRDILDGNEGEDSYSGAGEYFVMQTTSGGPFSGRYVQIDSNLRRIADIDYDDRHITVTLTGPDGLSISYVRNLIGSATYTGDTDSTVIFPLFDADTEYTVTRTVSGGLTGTHSESFNSSALPYSAGVYKYNFGDVLTTNTVCNKHPVNESLSPNCTVPNPPAPTTYPRNDYGYATISGGELTITPLANDVYTGSATIQLVGGASLGTASLSGNTITYTAAADKWGLDVIKYKITAQGQQSPIVAVAQIAVNAIEVQVPKSAWVGEPVRPTAVTKGLAAVPIPANATYAWTVSEKAIGYWKGVDELSHLTPVDGQLAKDKPRFYWVDGGEKDVGVTLTLPGGAPTASAKIAINRKTVSVSTIPSSVDIYTEDNGEIWLRFGKVNIQNEVAGVEFVRGLALGMPEGTFLWTQVINSTEVRYHRTSGIELRGFASGMCDNRYPYDIDPNGTDDSPGSLLSPSPIEGSEVDNVEFQDSYSMYLLWQPAVPDSIPVPLTVVHWGVSATAAWNGTTWVKLFGAPNVPPVGDDTTTYPVWLGAIKSVNDLTWIDGD